MLDQVIAAFEQKDYRTAAKLLRPLLIESPENHWLQLYYGKLKEVSNQTRRI